MHLVVIESAGASAGSVFFYLILFAVLFSVNAYLCRNGDSRSKEISRNFEMNPPEPPKKLRYGYIALLNSSILGISMVVLLASIIFDFSSMKMAGQSSVKLDILVLVLLLITLLIALSVGYVVRRGLIFETENIQD